MKKPSRHMQPYIHTKPKAVYMICISLLLILVIILYPKMLLIFLAIFTIGFVSMLIEWPKTKIHYENLLASRESLSICEFSREFNCREVDTWVIRATYEQLQHLLCKKKKIPIKASDRLKEDLLLDDDDIDMDLVEQISQRTGRSLNNYENNPYYGKVTTVKDLVLFFNSQKNSFDS